ncbi:hypothetical protein F5Y14DRAFT_39670 [Nemania sp. NC0429]|nr:hypothetical protein F5Y14DRAFT_39670 [Nemania sp. NC0429]
MRLLTCQDDGKLSFTKDLTSDIPPYATLSHTWGPDGEEVTFKDIIEGTGAHKDGYKKIQFCREQAASHDLKYFWVDSCCINRSNSTELSEAINSMFRWYRNAIKCYVYLSDVSTDGWKSDSPSLWEPAFRKSRWFTRGWTLQELIAPLSVEFFAGDGQKLGDKRSLEQDLHDITGIPILALRRAPLSDFSRRERMLWAEGRTTKLEEDRAYCLLGIFEIHFPLIYGEGVKNAFRRLDDEIDKQAAFEQPHLHNLPLALDQPPPVPVRTEENYSSCLQSLWFPGMNTRHLSIDKPAEQTGLWLFEHQSYKDWFPDHNRRQHGSFLWLQGKPGTGKSVLMKEAFRRAVLGQGKSYYWTAAFFFNAKGGELERSPLGLFRSLLYQLLPRDKYQLQRFHKLWKEKHLGYDDNESESCPWQEIELRTFLESMFHRQRAKRIIIFIDGFDECDTSRTSFYASFWLRLCLQTADQAVALSVCIASRSNSSVRLDSWQILLVEDNNSQDITTYVKKRVALSIADIEPEWQVLKNAIIRKSVGVFLWVVLVVEDLLEKWFQGWGVKSLLRHLDIMIPEGLEELFYTILAQIDQETKGLAIKVFQWAILATKPLRLHEWHHIMAFLRQPALSSLHEWSESDQFTADDNQLERQIKNISKGLIEVSRRKDGVQDGGLETASMSAGAGSLNVEQGGTRIVQVIHESVRQFFLRNEGFCAIDPSLGPQPAGYGHYSIMATCLNYIHIRELDALVHARNLVEQRDADRSILSRLPKLDPNQNLRVLSQFPSDPSGYPRAADYGRTISVGQSCDSRSGHHGINRKKTEPDSMFDTLRGVYDSGRIDINHWLSTLPTNEYVADLTSQTELAHHSPPALSVTGQSQVLEKYPALLFYATFEIFSHARLAEDEGANPDTIVRRLMTDGSWARLVTLREDIPHNMKLHDYATDLGLVSWVQFIMWTKLTGLSTHCHQDIPQASESESVLVPEPEPVSVSESEPDSSFTSESESVLVPAPELVVTVTTSGNRPWGSPSVASFSSAGSHMSGYTPRRKGRINKSHISDYTSRRKHRINKSSYVHSV